ncbi:hypothetical protein GF359_09645 [candidate division WOR-3 bacterium]|uniref:Uncharacterized protein n=1 Tax=candidate division WOR-3 bacterium TaxID=2052148 RepID=A0A9D5KAY1_UNCW3|nr:hypothetical protein [candidate division WOR-3 bacterium]MBD3365462.1 hypothetical protein [candidate division WOR-3 bacterium]
MILVFLLFTADVSVSGINTANFWLAQAETDSGMVWNTQFYNQAEADLYVDDFSIGGRFLLDAEDIRDTVTRTAITQRYLAYEGKDVSLILGNYYLTPGQGLVLSAFEDRDLREDRNLDGGLLSWESDFLQIGLLAGRMLAEDHVTRTDWMYSVNLNLFPADFIDAGAIYLRQDATDDADTLFGRAAEEWIEENLTLRIWRFDLTAAAAQRFTWGRKSAEGWVGVDNVKGLGLTGSLSYAQQGFGILLEVKDYKGLAGDINAPIPCNPDGESINEGADEQGFNVSLNLAPADWLWFEGSFSQAWDSTGDNSLRRIGAETRLDISTHTFTPFFTLIDREIPGGINPQNDMMEAGISYEILVGQVSLHLKPYYRRITEAAETWDEPHLLAEAGWESFLFSLGGVAEMRTDSIKLWPWGSLSYDAYPWEITFSYGRFKGEYICKSGVCAYELPFDGLKADLKLYF